jgi:hypothetical protein
LVKGRRGGDERRSLIPGRRERGEEMNAEVMQEQVEKLVNTFAESMVTTMAAAAEKMAVASQIVRTRAKVQGFSEVLEMLEREKAELRERIASSKGPTKKLYEKALERFTLREMQLLEAVEQEEEKPALKALPATVV